MQIQTKKKNGFTLVELLVTLGIMMLLMGVTMPFEISYRSKAEIKLSAKDLRSLFWEAQNRSLAPSDKDVTSYRISLAKGQGKLTVVSLQECKPLPTGCNPIKGAKLPQVTLGTNITIGDIIFDPLHTPLAGTETVDFAVGNNSKAGEISFSEKVTGSDVPIIANKIKIVIVSAATTLKYDIIIDKGMESITYQSE